MTLAAAVSLVVLHLTDAHFLAAEQQTMLGIDTEAYFVQVLALALSREPQIDVLILSGDLVQDICAESYQRLRTHLLKLPMPVLCLPGNHDDLDLMQALLNERNISCAKQRVFDHWQIICVNSQIPDEPGGFLSESELESLKIALETYPHHHALIAVHHHCVPTNSQWMDTMQIGNSAELLNLLASYPQAKVIINGHIHQAFAQSIANIHIFGTPSTCFQFTPNSRHFSVDKTPPGYRQLTLYSDGGVTTHLVRLSHELDELNLDNKGYLTQH